VCSSWKTHHSLQFKGTEIHLHLSLHKVYNSGWEHQSRPMLIRLQAILRFGRHLSVPVFGVLTVQNQPADNRCLTKHLHLSNLQLYITHDISNPKQDYQQIPACWDSCSCFRAHSSPLQFRMDQLCHHQVKFGSQLLVNHQFRIVWMV